MTLLRLAGFSAVRVTSSGARAHRADPARGDGARERRPAAAPARRPRLRLGLQRGLAHDAADARRPEGVRELRGRDRARHPGLPRRDRRQRAEPEPLLAAAVRPDRRGAAAPAYLRLLAATYDALKAASPDVRVWGGALAPRGVDRPNTGRDTLSPTRFLRDLGEAYRASGRTLPVMDGSRSIRTRQLQRSRRRAAVRPRPPRAHRLGQARPAARQGLRRHGTGRLGAADPLRRVRRRDGDPGGQARALRRRRARDDAPCRRDDAGGRLPPRAPARVLPVERRRLPALPRPGRGRSAGLAVRARLRGRHAEDLARAGSAGDGAGGDGSVRAARSWQRCRPRS